MIKARTVFVITKCWLIFMQILHTHFDRHWVHISKFINIASIQYIFRVAKNAWDRLLCEPTQSCRRSVYWVTNRSTFFRNQRSLIQILLLKSSSFEMIALFWSTIDEKLQSDIWESLMLQKKTTDSNEIKTDLSNLTKKVSFDIIVRYSLYHGV